MNFLQCLAKHPQKCLKTILISSVFLHFCPRQPHATFCTDAWHSVVESLCCHHDQAQLSLHDGNLSQLHSGIPELLNSLLLGRCKKCKFSSRIFSNKNTIETEKLSESLRKFPCDLLTPVYTSVFLIVPTLFLFKCVFPKKYFAKSIQCYFC